MAVRAKFIVQGKTENVVVLYAVTGGSKENEGFWKYTPAGSIKLHIDNPAALEQFEQGKEYYVDFAPAGE